MTRVKTQIVFENEKTLPRRVFEWSTEIAHPRSQRGEKYVADYLVSELQKELLWGEYHSVLPDVQDILRLARQTIRIADMRRYFDQRNTLWAWFEIGNILLRIKILLAQARACKDLEPAHSKNLQENEFLYDVHGRKMEKFDLAVFLLVKLEDLVLRLILENLGTSLLPADLGKPSWKRKLKRDSIKKELKRRGRDALGNQEYAEIKRILGMFRNPHFVRRFVEYRDYVAHGITPSVDYPELYTHLENRVGKPIYDAQGKRKGITWGIGGLPTKPEFDFLDLYDLAVKTLEHYISLLRQLRDIPRFSPAAVR